MYHEDSFEGRSFTKVLPARHDVSLTPSYHIYKNSKNTGFKNILWVLSICSFPYFFTTFKNIPLGSKDNTVANIYSCGFFDTGTHLSNAQKKKKNTTMGECFWSCSVVVTANTLLQPPPLSTGGSAEDAAPHTSHFGGPCYFMRWGQLFSSVQPSTVKYIR